MYTRQRAIIAAAISMAASTQLAWAQAPAITEPSSVDRGRYLVKIAGCNDCHTPGYPQADGRIDEKLWLTGSQIGTLGPWGTTYPVNLRLYMQGLSEDQWLNVAQIAKFRPPMPWFALHDMTAQDQQAIYRYVRFMGPAGAPAPAYLPPGQVPKGPYRTLIQPPQ